MRPVKVNNQRTNWGFGWGFATGATLALVALVSTPLTPSAPSANSLTTWVSTNLGHSVWFFSVVAVLFGIKLKRLNDILSNDPTPRRSQEVVALDQMLDVWIQVFIGVGVIWTAVGMRSALQSALGDPQAALTDDAGNVLRKLVDGGILLALSTTIVGAVGGYLMRVIKTLSAGSALQTYYETQDRQEITALLQSTQRIESHLGNLQPEPATVTPLPGRVQ